MTTNRKALRSICARNRNNKNNNVRPSKHNKPQMILDSTKSQRLHGYANTTKTRSLI